MSAIKNDLSILLANTYALYLKTQNYHWHVKGLQFSSLHQLFETHYTELAEAVDEVAERLRMLGEKAPATFSEFNQLKTLEDGNSDFSAEQMVSDLFGDHQHILSALNRLMAKAAELNEEGTVSLLSERIASHEKAAWFLSSSL